MGPVHTPAPTSRLYPVPWTPRDVWLSVASVALLYSMAVFLLLRMPQLRQHGMAVLLGLELLLVVPVGYVAGWKYRGGWETLGFRTFPYDAIKWGGLVLLQFYLCTFVYGLVLMLFHLRMHTSVVSIVKRFSPWFLMLLAVVLTPVIEEMFFRGFVFAGLRQRYSLPTAAVVSAVLFAIGHLQWTLFVPLVVAGYLLADLYERSNSLWPPMVIHAMVNTFALGMTALRLRTGLPH